jgi:hypothetical protein
MLAGPSVSVGLHVADHGFDGGSAAEFAFDDTEDAAFLSRDARKRGCLRLCSREACSATLWLRSVFAQSRHRRAKPCQAVLSTSVRAALASSSHSAANLKSFFVASIFASIFGPLLCPERLADNAQVGASVRGTIRRTTL